LSAVPTYYSSNVERERERGMEVSATKSYKSVGSLEENNERKLLPDRELGSKMKDVIYEVMTVLRHE